MININSRVEINVNMNSAALVDGLGSNDSKLNVLSLVFCRNSQCLQSPMTVVPFSHAFSLRTVIWYSRSNKGNTDRYNMLQDT